jgi:pre-mRNA-processing factor 6
MAFRSRFNGQAPQKPANYIPGIGRGATGFTTRSDVGPASSDASVVIADGSSSRSAEARKALMQHKQQTSAFGAAPANYIAGAGRGATRFSRDNEDGGGGTGVYDAFGGYIEQADETSHQYDEDDNEADQIWAAIDERMNSKRRKRKTTEEEETVGGIPSHRYRISYWISKINCIMIQHRLRVFITTRPSWKEKV